ncbi:MAG TPA: fatty acid desaturase [Bryobacteraceae bacterium]|jgi:fatty acid desaturase|nr:fatty acid desaturase [Bryobacteraceae bacterium]
MKQRSSAEDNAVRTPPAAIPQALNIALAFIAGSCAVALLQFVSHANHRLQILAGAVAFSYVNNTVFSLLHEAVHGVFHSSRQVNDLFGRWLAAFFPTSFSLQRLFHLGHHQRNRSPAERFDYISPGQNAFIKRAQWYGILTGLYWLLPPLSSFLYLLAPNVFSSRFFRNDEAAWSRQSGAGAMVAGIGRVRYGAASAEVLFAIAWQIALFHFLDLNFAGWALCYAGFAVNWSSLQYADHAWSELDPLRGAWNLRVNPVVRWLFLNYHHHRVHHEDPRIPWIHLGRFVNADEPRPSFWKIYLSMWKGPRPLPEET